MKGQLVLLLLLLTGTAQAITPWDKYSITQAVGQGTWEATEQLFRKLREGDLPPGQVAQVDYNLGVALYEQGKYEESLPLFETAAKTEKDALKAKALYNQGNALFKLDKLDEAKTAFQQALLTNPDDDDTRHNLEVILEKQQQNQNQQNPNGQEDQENKESDKEKQDDQGESDEQEQDKKNKGDQNQDESDNKDGQGQQDQQQGEQDEKQQGQQQEMTEQEKKEAQEAAERARLLDYFKQQERDGRPAQRVRAQAPPVRGKTW